MTTKEIQDYVYNYLSQYLPLNSVFGIMGNISQESSWDVQEVEEGNGIGFGLCQWSFSRRTDLENFGTSLQKQCQFILKELNTQWFNAGGYTKENFVNGNYSPIDAAKAFCWCWERPNANEANLARRVSEAIRFSHIYGNGSIKEVLTSMGVIRQGEKSERVKLLQAIFNIISGAGLVVDGDFGEATKQAVINYQKVEGITADGEVGEQTINTLLEDLKKNHFKI
jgi:hypothetical protein